MVTGSSFFGENTRRWSSSVRPPRMKIHSSWARTASAANFQNMPQTRRWLSLRGLGWFIAMPEGAGSALASLNAAATSSAGRYSPSDQVDSLWLDSRLSIFGGAMKSSSSQVSPTLTFQVNSPIT